MRTIKFRAWEKPGAVPHGNGWFEGKMHEVVPNHLNSFFDYCLSNPREYELMQFTGLLDKNGKEIYEGDVVKVVTKDFDYPDVVNNGEVRFEKGHWEVINHQDNYYLYGQDEIEVIGNIYENPDLLR